MKCGIQFCFLFFIYELSLFKSEIQNRENTPQRLAWQRQIDRVKENERRLEEFVANQTNKAKDGGKKKIIEVQGKTSDIFNANLLESAKQVSLSYQNIGRIKDNFIPPKESHLAEAEKLIEKYRNLIDGPSTYKYRKNGRNYLNEAEQFLKSFKSNGSVEKPIFSPSKKTKSPLTVKQAAKMNVGVPSSPGPRPTTIKSNKDITSILAQNINTKEGLKAIVTELLKRRIEKLTLSQKK